MERDLNLSIVRRGERFHSLYTGLNVGESREVIVNGEKIGVLSLAYEHGIKLHLELESNTVSFQLVNVPQSS